MEPMHVRIFEADGGLYFLLTIFRADKSIVTEVRMTPKQMVALRQNISDCLWRPLAPTGANN
jgi:hypothetical protein